ncbi:MAG: type II toxin-antitoxin system HicB family antitoxin [Armatimonadota bacterium]|jgi:predicted RNase H-like HicB family nuclease
MADAGLTAVVWLEGRRYVSHCPELGVASYGKRPGEAVEALREVVELHVENAKAFDMLAEIEPALSAAEPYTTFFDVALA